VVYNAELMVMMIYAAVSFIDDCMTSSLTSHHVNTSSSAAIHLTADRGHVALYPGSETSTSDWTVSSCHWSVEAPAGRTIVVAWKIALGGWTTSTAGHGN